MQDHFI